MDKWMLLLSKFGYHNNHSYIYINKIIKMEKQITAIEWLEAKVNGMIENGGDYELLEVIEHIQKAKEMEEEQIMNAWVNGVVSEDDITAKKYYNKTYKQEE